jgi:hypothetical protein
MIECCARGEHKGKVNEYYCTDGGIVVLCEKHLPTCNVVVWDGPTQPITVKYYDEVYSKK